MAEAMIVITDCNHVNIDAEKAVFQAAGIPYKAFQCRTEDDLIANCRGAVAVCNQRAPFTEKVFAALPELKMVVRYGDGVDNVDLEAATRHGVQVCNVPDYGTSEVANHALALMLAITRKICQANDQVRAGRWNYAEMVPIQHLANMTVGVIGLGRIGLAFAKRVHALGCRVIGFDIFTDHVKGDPECSFIELTSEDDVISRADVLSLHCSLNAQDARMMNAESFAKMKRGAMFVNVTRGGLVEEAALAEALKSGHLPVPGSTSPARNHCRWTVRCVLRPISSLRRIWRGTRFRPKTISRRVVPKRRYADSGGKNPVVPSTSCECVRERCL